MASNKLSNQAKQLKPYILPWIEERVTRSLSSGVGSGGGGGSPLGAHSLDGAYHTGTLADSQATQFLKTDGSRSLTGDLGVSAGITIDGVDISVLGARTVSAGDGIDSDGTTLADGNPTVSVDVTDILGADITEDGSNNLIVNKGATFTWTAAHTWNNTTTFNSDPQVAANIDFTGGNRTITGNADITLQPGDDLFLDPTGNEVQILSSVRIGTDNFASQTTGWAIDYAGGADFRYVFVDELHAKAFIADLEQALAGGQIICKSVTTLAEDFTLPAAGASGTVYVNDLPSAQDMAVFQSGDMIAFRQFSRAGGGLIIAWGYGTVSSYVDRSGADEGTQQWTFTRLASGGGLASGTINAEAIVLDFGVSGNGFYEVNAIDGIYAVNSPYSQIVTWTTNPSNRTVRVRTGNLTGIGFSGEWGQYIAGSSSTQYIKASAAGIDLYNVDFSMWDGSTRVGWWELNYGINLREDTSVVNDQSRWLAWWEDLDGATPSNLGAYIGRVDDTLWVGSDPKAASTWGGLVYVVAGGYAAGGGTDAEIRMQGGTSGSGDVSLYGNVHVQSGYSLNIQNTGVLNTHFNYNNTGYNYITSTTNQWTQFRDTSGTILGYIGKSGSYPYWLINTGSAQQEGGVVIGALTGRPSLEIARVSGFSSIKSSAGSLIMDSAGGNGCMLNYYVSDNVYLAYGGGHVGIGAVTPLYALHILDNSSYVQQFISSNNLYGASTVWNDTSAAANTQNYFARSVDGHFYIGSATDGLSYTNRISINESGYVGINDDDASYTLDVNGTIRTTADMMVGDMLHLYGSDSIQSSPETVVSNSVGWKDVLYSNIYARGIAANTYAVKTGLTFSVFSNTNPANDSTGASDPDSNACFSVNSSYMHTTAALGEAWANASLTADWTTASGYGAAGYKKVGDMVMLRGVVDNTTGDGSPPDTIFTLPSGYRPASNRAFIVMCRSAGETDNVGRINIDTAGVVSHIAGNVGAHLSFDGVYFTTS